MSKGAEQAYKELARDEAPDLWNRIEAGLKDKTEAASQSVPVQRKSVSVVLKRYFGVAAAALCVIILVPTLILMNRAGVGEKHMETEKSAVCEDVAPAETALAEEETAGMAAGEELEETSEETAAMTKEAEMTEDAAAEEAIEFASSEKTAADTVKGVGAGMNVQSTEERLFNETEQRKSEAVKLQDGDLLSRIQVMVTEEREGAVYYVIVEKDDSGILAEGEKIRVFRPADASFLMKEGESITLELRYSKKDGYFAAEQVSDDN